MAISEQVKQLEEENRKLREKLKMMRYGIHAFADDMGGRTKIMNNAAIVYALCDHINAAQHKNNIFDAIDLFEVDKTFDLAYQKNPRPIDGDEIEQELNDLRQELNQRRTDNQSDIHRTLILIGQEVGANEDLTHKQKKELIRRFGHELRDDYNDAWGLLREACDHGTTFMSDLED